MTVEHVQLQPLLDRFPDTRAVVRSAGHNLDSRGRTIGSVDCDPREPVRGIVAGDLVRKLVARAMSLPSMEAMQVATAPV